MEEWEAETEERPISFVEAGKEEEEEEEEAEDNEALSKGKDREWNRDSRETKKIQAAYALCFFKAGSTSG